jgi:hypothetical protein
MSTRLSICFTTLSIISSSAKVVIVNLWMPCIADGETESVSMFNCRRVKIIVIWFRRPTVFSEKIITVYNFFVVIASPPYLSPNIMFVTLAPAGTIGNTIPHVSTLATSTYAPSCASISAMASSSSSRLSTARLAMP